jgi:hypothetical protein
VQAIPTVIGGSQILIEAPEGDLDAALIGEYGTQETGIRDDLRDAYGQLKAVITDLAHDMSASIQARDPNGPSELGIEFGLSFSGGANMWVLTSSSEVSCKVSMTWSSTRREPR